MDEKNTVPKQQVSAKEKMLKGSAWMTAGSIFSRVLGAIYIIPWYSWFGSDRLQANALYTKGYTIYSLFIMIATAGIPAAVAKQVSKYNALNEYQVGRRLYKKSFGIMLALGILCAAILWLGAPFISQGDKNVIPVYRSLAIALTVIPIMSLTRGFFQGYQDMAPSALSQLVEQIVRIVYMLAATFLLMKLLQADYVSGVVQSTFAAFIGALGGLGLLAFYYLKKKRSFDQLAKQSNNQLEVSDNQLLKEVLSQSVPFILVGAAINIYNLIDQYSFQPIMQHVNHWSLETINAYYALFAGNANKLIMIAVSLGSALAATVVPLLSAAATRKDKVAVQKQLLDSFELFLFVMLPSSFGMAAVAKPLYVLFYGYDFTGVYVLRISAYLALFLGMYMVCAALVQGVYHNKMAIRCTLVGLIVKLILQYPLTATLNVYGPLLATGIGMVVSCTLMLSFLYYKYQLNIIKTQKRANLLMIFAMLMYVVVFILVYLLSLLINPYSRIGAMVILVIVAGIGGWLYVFLCLKSRVADAILGAKTQRIRHLLRIK
ncbi:polysaccharide biosynthesis protein [Ligilactobacillus sp. Marseille-Q7487]|jgi:O-antigen/teichoic acid export membrane protein|uniref:putative polysaccharide biosynthesis protein n=1 Tax=Ligilactobacillus sp. Marseille-Q7487 TaxID=3022128 RepID=UPI0015B40941|nr:polysaccharide biosynthesis protein [Ligilactobacillus sp. Marseille-Q7487]